MKKIAFLLAALLFPNAILAQSVAISSLPQAQPLAGNERMPGVQNGQPVAITPDRIIERARASFQPLDPDLTAIAALATLDFGRQLLTRADGAAVRSAIGLGLVNNTADASKAVLSASRFTTARLINGVSFDGSANITINAVDSTARAPAARIIATTAPLLGGGDLSADRTFSISPASTTAPGSMSAADKSKLDGIAAGATANTGTVTSVAIATANGVSGTVANASTTPSITLSLGAITPASVAATGAISGSSLSLTNALTIANGGTGATSASAARTNLGLGTAATVNTGTSGATIPLLTGTNTWSGLNSFTSTGTAAAQQIASFTAGSVPTGGSGTGPFLNFGVASSTNNSGVLQFTYTAAGSANNFMALGVFGNASILNVFPGGVGIGTGATVPPANGLSVLGPVQAARHCYTATVCDYAGSGTPLGNLAAPVGSTYRRTDGGAATTFYVKESGTDASGWVAK